MLPLNHNRYKSHAALGNLRGVIGLYFRMNLGREPFCLCHTLAIQREDIAKIVEGLHLLDCFGLLPSHLQVTCLSLDRLLGSTGGVSQRDFTCGWMLSERGYGQTSERNDTRNQPLFSDHSSSIASSTTIGISSVPCSISQTQEQSQYPAYRDTTGEYFLVIHGLP